MEDLLEKNLKVVDKDFIAEIASYLYRPLTREYQEVAKSVFTSTTGSKASVNRKSHNDYQEKIIGLWSNMRLFEKGITYFKDDTRILLVKHLLKTIGSDIVNIIFEAVANENLMSLAENEVFTQESRLKLLSKLTGDWKAAMTKLNSSLNGKELDEFFGQVEVIADANHCDFMLKKIDKKKERQLLFNHRQNLMDQLARETEPAMTLHLACVLLFQQQTNVLLHTPGRCVPHIIAYLKDYLAPIEHTALSEYQQLVMRQLSVSRKVERTLLESNSDENSTSAEVAKNEENLEKSLSVLLSEGLSQIKDIVKNRKKFSIVEK